MNLSSRLACDVSCSRCRRVSISELGGTVHYSQEFRLYLAGLPSETREQIIRDIERRARPRRVYVNIDPMPMDIY